MPDPNINFNSKYYEQQLQIERVSNNKELCQKERIEVNKKIFEKYKQDINKAGALDEIKVIITHETRKNVLEVFLKLQPEWILEHFKIIYEILLKRQNTSDWAEERQILSEMRQLMINQITTNDPAHERKISCIIEQEIWNEVFTILIRKLKFLQAEKDALMCISWTSLFNWVVIKNLNDGLPDYLEKDINSVIELADKKGAGIERYRAKSLENSPIVKKLLQEMHEKNTQSKK